MSNLVSSYNPDVLSCIANLSNDEVFTPPEVANAMLDMLPQELFSDPNTTFLDPATKSGVFLREIAKRLLVGLEPTLPDLQERLDHIMHKQLYGIAITELTSLLSRRSLYCSKYPNSVYSVSAFDDIQGNIRFKNVKHRWKDGKCVYCGAAESEYGNAKRAGLEQHAYEFIHNTNPREIFNMKFDVIIGNPPYQLNDGGSGTGISAKPIYHHFVRQAMKLKPRYLTMIIPSRWFAGGKGLDEFRSEMINDPHISRIVDYMSSKDCFDGVNIAGGVNYFLWDREYCGECLVENRSSVQKTQIMKRGLNEFSVFIRDNRAIPIIRKFLLSKDQNLMDNTFTRNPFGFVSKERGMKKIDGDKKQYVSLYSSEGWGFVKRDLVVKNSEFIDKFKVIIGKIVPSNGEVDTDPRVGYKVTTSNQILKPGEIHTESYLLLGCFDSFSEARNFSAYMTQKFPRFMMKQTLSSMNISTQNFMFVPFLDFHKEWCDQDLYCRYGLSDEEIEYIESLIRPMDIEQGD